MIREIKIIYFKYLVKGIIFGACFPLISICYDIYNENLEFSLSGLVQVHRLNHLLFIIDTAPFFLGFMSLIAAKNFVQSYKLNISLKETTLELKNSKLRIEEVVQLLEEKNNILEKDAITDPLTGLKNEKCFLEKIGKDLKEDVILCIFDICYFREINTLFGDNIGDELLKYFSKRLLDNNFEVYRLHEDNFAILCTENAEALEIDTFINYISDLICYKPFDINGEEIFLTVNFGVSIYKKSSNKKMTSKNLLHDADFALKYAKEKRLQYSIFNDEIINTSENNYNYHWKKKIITSMKNNKIEAFYQPIINNKNMKIEKFEALIRIDDEHNNYISPYSFISSSKKYGLYNRLTQLMIVKVFENIENTHCEISINMSIDDIRNISTMKLLFNKLNYLSLEKSSRIVFELLESEGIENYEEVKRFIESIKKYNCKIAIDDFGSGYSNFSHILNLKVDYIKIDASIIKKIDKDINSEYVAKLIVDFSKKVGIKTIAEFVHSKEVFEKVNEIGIDYSQGYYFSAPYKDIKTLNIKQGLSSEIPNIFSEFPHS